MQMGNKTRSIPMPSLQLALDAESFEFMASSYPDVLQALEREVAAGHKPKEIRTFVLLQTGRIEIAMRCEQVARHILAAQS